MKNIPEWITTEWKELKAELLTEFKSRDVIQQMHSRQYLKAFKNRIRGEKEDLRTYVRRFTAISTALINKNQLEAYTQGIWFLEGLPEKVREKLIRKEGVTVDSPDSVKFAGLAKAALKIYDTELTVREFAYSESRQCALSSLVDRHKKENLGKADSGKREFVLAPPVVPEVKKEKNLGVEELTKAFEKIALSLSTAARTSFSPPGGENRGNGGQGAGRGYSTAGVSGLGQVQDERKCYYCREDRHIRPRCEKLKEDEAAGRCHLNSENQICFRRPGPAARRAFLYRDRTQREQVLAYCRANRLGEPEGPITAAANSITVEYGDSESDVETDDGWSVDGVEPAEVNLGRAERLTAKDKWKTLKAILKRKVETEKKLAIPKTPWKVA